MPKVWFVTGSSRGLGRAVVEVALEAGDRVAATPRHPERLGGLHDRCGDALLLLRLDVTDFAAAARGYTGRTDVRSHRWRRYRRGVSRLGIVRGHDDRLVPAQIDTDFCGVVNVSKALVPVLREQASGHIFQVSSLIVRLTRQGLTAYQVAKCAVAGFSLGLAQEIAPFGVTVTSLSRAPYAPTGVACR